MPQVYRVSLVVMVFASEIKKRTPEPFLELRCFLFSDRIPTPFEEVRIKQALRISINEIMEKFLPHIFLTDKNEFNLLSHQTATPINLTQNQLTKMTRIEIEGFEVEKMDIDEIIHEKIYWKELNARIDHNLFKEDRITHGRLSLNTFYIYRYAAFYDENGDIKGEYDEFDIKGVVQQRIMLQNTQNRLYKKMLGNVDALYKDIGELEGSLTEFEKVSQRLRNPL